MVLGVWECMEKDDVWSPPGQLLLWDGVKTASISCLILLISHLTKSQQYTILKFEMANLKVNRISQEVIDLLDIVVHFLHTKKHRTYTRGPYQLSSYIEFPIFTVQYSCKISRHWTRLSNIPAFETRPSRPWLRIYFVMVENIE